MKRILTGFVTCLALAASIAGASVTQIQDQAELYMAVADPPEIFDYQAVNGAIMPVFNSASLKADPQIAFRQPDVILAVDLNFIVPDFALSGGDG